MASLHFLRQASLAILILLSFAASFASLSTPNPSRENIKMPSSGDSLRLLKVAGTYTPYIALSPFAVSALHTALLVLAYPALPPRLAGYGADNGLDTRLLRWSWSTAIPLAIIFCLGAPLRQVAYFSLGTNFTFTLAEPDHLKTDGIYHYVQHPSYTGLVLLIIGNITLLARADGVMSCWVPPSYFPAMKRLWWICAPAAFSVTLMILHRRVQEEESMLRAEFGAEWEQWHASTARFIPWIF
jgi:protein-S-isoprenylcysteine O-methyltransferase Ste14